MFQRQSRILLHLLLLLPLFTPKCYGVQLAELVGRPAYFGAYVIRRFSDDTFLATGFSGLKSYLDLRLHPIVKVPNPPRTLSSTILLARVYPHNNTVIWATAITTMDITVGIDIDQADNVYVAAPPKGNDFRPFGTVHIIKHKPTGSRVYATYYTPSPKSPEFDIEESDFPRSSQLWFIPPRTLLVPGGVRNTDKGPSFATFKANSGKLIRIKGSRKPKEIVSSTAWVFDPSSLAARGTRKGPIACYGFVGARNTFKGPEKVFVRCENLNPGGSVITREIASVDGKSDFFIGQEVAMEEKPKSKRQPSLFVTYERVVFTSRKVSVHDLFIRRLDSETLEDVDWATGTKSASARPIVMSLPEPNPTGNSHTTFVKSMRYSRKSRSVAIFLWTDTPFVRFLPEPKEGGKITAVGNPKGRSDPTQFWVFFFNQKRELFTRRVNTEFPGRGPEGFVPSEMQFSRNEKCVYVNGFPFRSGLRNVSNPIVTRSRGEVC